MAKAKKVRLTKRDAERAAEAAQRKEVAESKEAKRKSSARRINTTASRRSIQERSLDNGVPAVIRIERTSSGLFRVYFDDGTQTETTRLEFYQWMPPKDPYRFLVGGWKQAREGRSKQDVKAWEKSEARLLREEQRAEQKRIEEMKKLGVPASQPTTEAAPAAKKEIETMAIVKKNAESTTAASKNEKAAAKKSSKKAAPAAKGSSKKAAVKKAEKKEPAGTDVLGSRLGSQAAAINKAFSEKAQSVEQIVKKAGLPQPRVRLHIRWAVENGYLKEDKDGNFKLTGKTA